MINFIRNNYPHIFVPAMLLFLSKNNEQFWLNPDHNPNLLPLYFVRLLLILCGFFLSKRVHLFYKFIKKEGGISKIKRETKVFLVIFGWFTLWYGFWLFIYYPGSYTSDTTSVLQQISKMRLDNWFSYIQPLLNLFLYQILPHLLVLGIFQVLLCSFVFSKIFSYFLFKINLNNKVKLPIFIVFLAFFSYIPSITAYTFFYSRDIPFSVLQLYLAFICFKAFIESNKPLSFAQILEILFLSVLLALYRSDGIAVLAVVLITFILFRKNIPYSIVKIIPLTLVVFFISNQLVPKVLGVKDTYGLNYTLTLVAFPLGYVVSNDYISNNYQKDEEIINTITTLGNLESYTSCYGVHDFMYSENKWNTKATKEQFDVFYKNSYKIFLQNPHLFLAARTCNFIAQVFSPTGRAEQLNDGGRYWINYNNCKDPNNRPVECKMIPLCDDEDGICGYTNVLNLRKISDHWNFNTAFALIISIMCLILYKYLPYTALASAIILSRLPIIFLAAPAIYFRYMFSLYLFGIFILFFIILEIQYKKLPPRYKTRYAEF